MNSSSGPTGSSHGDFCDEHHAAIMAADGSPAVPAHPNNNTSNAAAPTRPSLTSSLPPDCRAADEGPTPIPIDSLRLHKMGFIGLFFGLASILPYTSVLFSVRGFSPVMVGALNAVAPLATLIFVPVLAVLADKHGTQTQTTLVSLVVATVALSVMCVADSLTTVGVAAVLFFVFQSPLTVFYDEHVTTALEDHKEAYGSVRCFGAYAWAVGAPLASYLFGVGGWYIVPFMWLLGQSIFAYCLVSSPHPRALTSKHYSEVVGFVTRRPRLMLFFAAVSFMGIGYVFISTFLFLYLKELNAPDVLLGVTIFFTVCIEIPIFRNAQWIHARYTDRQIFSASCVAWCVRVLGYSLITNPYFVLLFEPLHGFTFGCMWLACVHFISTEFPQDLLNTGFAVINAAAFGLGPLVGNVLGGYLYQSLGPRYMFRYSSAVMAAVVVAYVLLDIRLASRATVGVPSAPAGSSGSGGAVEDRETGHPSTVTSN